MDWTSIHDRQALKRVVALLFAFARLAELASSKPRPLRAAVLWLLRTAEAVGQDFVSAMAEGCRGHIVRPDQPSSLDVADDGIRLAHSFRALAELLGAVLSRGLPPRTAARIGRHPTRASMQKLKNLATGHSALARSAPEPPHVDSS